MATKPNSEIKAKPPKSIVDREIGERGHDNLVNWLIEHRSEVIDYQFAFDDQKIESEAEAALARWRDDWNEHIDEAKDFSQYDDENISQGVSAMLAQADKSLTAFEAPPLPVELGTTSIENWSSQAEIYVDAQRPGQPKKLVAFVDVTVDFTRCDGLELSTPAWPQFELRLFGEALERRSVMDRNLLQGLKSIRFSGYQWQCRSRPYRVYYDVRAELTALGETLQSLKTLRSHIDDGIVCLFVEDIPELWQDVLRNEEFFVLTQREMFRWIAG
jgi:hypothetical protein